MTRSELVAQVVRHAGVGTDAARAALDAVFGAGGEPGLIATALARGERVQLAGFGTFEVRQRKARVGLNPQTRQPIAIPAQAALLFRPGGGLRQHVRGDGLRAPAAGL
jgi:DNA-binding protein HU-beta